MASILSYVNGDKSIVTWVNNILETYCQGAVHKKSDKILPGNVTDWIEIVLIIYWYFEPIRLKVFSFMYPSSLKFVRNVNANNANFKFFFF